MLECTPLFAAHCSLGARCVEFSGWEMPVQYSGIVDEHLAVRRAAGLFDISHMGEIQVSGPGAAAFLNHALTNDLRRLAVGQGQYTLLCLHSGGTVDDLYAYRVKEDEYLLVVNASRVTADWDWLQTLVERAPTPDGFRLKNASAELAAVAIQGPATAGFIDVALPGGSIGGTMTPGVSSLRRNEIARFVFRGTPVYVARTGYTGEDGFEAIAPAAAIASIWQALLDAGGPCGLKPAGLGARDTLRTEMGYPLYGHEIDENTSPLEAGLGAFVALDKGDFVGRAALVRQKDQGFTRKCAAFRMTVPSPPPRPGYPVWVGPAEAGAAGRVVSGTQSPSLGVGIGLAYVPASSASPGTPIAVEIRSRRFEAVIARKPLYHPAPPAAAAPARTAGAASAAASGLTGRPNPDSLGA
jgi:aminomethyltransferase